MRRELLLLGLCGSACAFSLQDVDVDKALSGTTKLVKAAAGFDREHEIGLGRDIASALAARDGVSNATAEERYLSLVGQTLVRHSDRADWPFHFGILKSQDYNAYATPGGYIFVTEGLLSLVEDESELAGVLAHEVTHVTHAHIVKAIRKANLIGAGEDLADANGKNDAAAYAPLTHYSLSILDKGLSRSDELDADQGGVQLAAACGYDPKGLVRVIERLKAQSPTSPAMLQLTKTHPRPDDRLKALAKTIAGKALPDSGARLPDRYRSVFPAATAKS